jgi:hypothetical protein
MKARIKEISYISETKIGDVVEARPSKAIEGGYELKIENGGSYNFIFFRRNEYELLQDDHYNNDNGSLYLFAQQHGLNAYEFEVIKRIVRCRKKGEFISDIEKTKRVLDLYLKEQGHNYKDQVEQLNK